MSILEKLTQLHELNTIISKKSKDFSYLIKINIYKSLIDFIDINSETEFTKYFNKNIIGFKSSKYYTVGNELQNSINTFIDIDDFMFKIDNIKGGLINNNIIDFYNELYSFIIKQLAIYVPSKKALKKTIEPKKIIIEEPKKKELTPYNAFFKEQSLLIKDNYEIKNKMEYIAKLWKEHKEDKKEEIEIKEDKKEEIKKQVKKQTISATIKKLVWNMHIGEEIGKAKCVCCKSSYISQMSFHCGHIIAESKGGEMIVSNLRPICQNCNSSMGNKNMEEFMKTLL